MRDLPPAKLTFYGPAVTPAPTPSVNGHSRLIDRLRCGDAGRMALLTEWLHGCYTASSLPEALQKREQLEPGACLVVASGHIVYRHGVSFYAADSEQAGLLARAHEIDNLEREVRAQSLLAEQAREAVQRAEAAYAQDTQRLAELRRTTLATQQQQHAAQVQWLRLSQLAEQAQSRSTQLERDLAEVQTQLQELAQRSADGLQRFESLDAGLGVQQEAQAEQDDAVRAAEAALQTAREQQRPAAAPGAPSEQFAVVPEVADRLAEHVGQEVNRDDAHEPMAPDLVAAERTVEVERGAAVLGLLGAPLHNASDTGGDFGAGEDFAAGGDDFGGDMGGDEWA